MKRMSRVACIFGALALLSCAGILGVEDISVDPTLDGIPFIDASAPVGVPDGGCVFPSDCPLLDTTPPGCANATCANGICMYHAVDSDGDGHRTAKCTTAVATPIELGDDCDDKDALLFPGASVPCGENEQGMSLGIPANAVGICKMGTKACDADGGLPVCRGAVGPQTVTSCTPSVDEGCDGNPLQGCSCTTGQTTDCGSSAVGHCKKGTATCQGNGTFGACVGNIEPTTRDCTTSVDMNCNGTPDNQEAECQCAGGGAPGATRACNTHPGQDGIGQCVAGSQTCVASGATSTWSGCSGDVGPQTEQCDGVDRDCNGVAGVDDPAPAAPAGTLNCTKVYRCSAANRGPLYYRNGVGWTNYAGSNTIWTGYAVRGDYSSMTYPPGWYRISRDSTGTKMGPVSIASACCAAGCATANVFYDGVGQFYTAP